MLKCYLTNVHLKKAIDKYGRSTERRCITLRIVNVRNDIHSMLDLIAPKFAYRATNDYGCAARGSLDPFVSNAGKPVDEIDRAINNWKYCIRCAMDVLTEGNDPALPKYKFDADKRICRKKFKYYIKHLSFINNYIFY